MPNDVDTLMALVNTINAKTPAEVTDHDITVLVAYHRHNRSRRAAGHKTLKPEKPRVNVLGMLGLDTKPKAIAPPVPAGPGIRRF